jgi:hypothetical protein
MTDDCDLIIVADDDAVILAEPDAEDDSERATLDEFGIMR